MIRNLNLSSTDFRILFEALTKLEGNSSSIEINEFKFNGLTFRLTWLEHQMGVRTFEVTSIHNPYDEEDR